MGVRLMGALAVAGAVALAGCGGDDEESDVQAFCDKLAQVRETEDPLTPLLQGGNVEETKQALEDAQTQFAEIAEVAPEEIRADVESAQQFIEDFVAAAQDAETPKDILSIVTELQGRAEELQASGQRLSEYENENCDTQAEGTG
jgi:hypothetical protein